MTLLEICTQLAEIERKMDYGEIPYSINATDKLSLALQQNHPVEVFDDILSKIYYPVMAGVTPTQAKIKSTVSGLKKFQKAFGVELSAQISALSEHLE